jgi:hypothetical protein
MAVSLSPIQRSAFLFDLDGTLVDSVYQHVLAWREALAHAGTELSVWRIRRRIGMSGGLLVNALLRETGGGLSSADSDRLQSLHAQAYKRLASQVRPLPGARELLTVLADAGVPHAIAISGRLETARPALEMLGRSSGLSGDHAGSGALCKARPGPVPCGGGALGRIDPQLRRCWRQHMGPACCPAGACASGRTVVGRVWARGTSKGWGISRLRGPSRLARAPRRNWSPEIGCVNGIACGKRHRTTRVRRIDPQTLDYTSLSRARWARV